MSGYFGADGFWNRHILQAAFHEPVIQYTLAAVGSLHEAYEYDQIPSMRHFAVIRKDYSVDQHNRAIRSLLRTIEQGQLQLDVCLMACILFTLFEVKSFRGAP